MRFPALLLLACLPCSCTIRPTVRDAQGNLATLGGSFLSRSKSETAYYKGPLGEMGYSDTEKDETVVPATYIKGDVIKSLSGDMLSAHNTTNATTQTIGAQGVQKTQINATKAVDLKKLSPSTIKAQEALVPVVTP